MSNYNTGTSGQQTAGLSTNLTAVLPSGIIAGDQLFFFATIFCFEGGNLTDITCTATSGHTWSKVGPLNHLPDTNGFSQYSVCYTRTATSGDASDTLTLHLVGTAGGTDGFWWSWVMGAYTGFPGGVDVHAEYHNATPAGQGHDIYPSVNTAKDADWALYLGYGAINGSGNTGGVGPTGTTGRQHVNNSGIDAILSDSNGSVGASGTTIGGINQAYSGGSTPDGWVTTQTIGLSTTSSAVTGTGSIAMKKMKIAIQGRLPGTGNIHMKKMRISGTGTAPLRGTGIIKMKKMKLSGQGSQPELLMVYQSTDGNGVDTYLATSPYNGPSSHTVRVLTPTSPGAGYSHAFLYTLAVTADGDGTFGEGLDTVRVGGWHNTYNMTVVEPQFGIDPWFADSDIDLKYHFETFMLRLSDWVKNHLASTGIEKQVLIGFSKSGIGGQGLILNNPTVFDKCISWDFPTDGDMTSRFVGNADINYGTSANFNARYDLGATNLARWKGPFQGPKPRLYIADGISFDSDVSDYDARLTAQTMTHVYPTPVTRSHSWDSGWVGPALAAMMTQEVSGSGNLKMKKMRLGGTATAPLVGTGTIKMKKMKLASSGQTNVVGSGVIHMKKMRIHITTPGATGRSSSPMLVFTEV